MAALVWIRLHLFLCSMVFLQAGVAVATPVLRVAIEEADNRPYEYRDEAGQWTGYHIEAIRAAASRMGVEIKILPLPWSRALAMLKNGEVEAASYVASTPERAEWAVFYPGNSLHIPQARLYILRSRAAQISWQGSFAALIGHWQVGGARGYYYGPEWTPLLTTSSNADLSAPNQQALMRMLLRKRIDIAIGSVDMPTQLADELPEIAGKVIALDGVARTGQPIYIAFNRRTADDKARRFADILGELRQDGTLRRLALRFNVLGSANLQP
ncbi:hypothetical protein IGB42_01422 [Andreprevotia sp. IGB-42]|uniref:substrate-binding periplasmic protein n=1 Tax=Andreprevotia sp. IGB-42 TaxID=2497473 RepID=UPI00135C9EE3|nr:transporter substrate-binding domain-containing protein [Andreprevotia sp. IGB-42]KAF0813743.1 hypothetical protein IGB42_01422 [Andreprevotia sp. IGB-42]